MENKKIETNGERFLTMKDVLNYTGVKSPSTIYRRMKKDPDFPEPIAMGFGRIRFKFSEISAWMQTLPVRKYDVC